MRSATDRVEDTVLGRIAQILETCQTFVVVTHVRPDGDALGALLATTRMLQKMGKSAIPCCHDELPDGYEFLPGCDEIQRQIPEPRETDAAVVVDCGEMDRVEKGWIPALRQIGRVINIDHHMSHKPFGTVSWVEPAASSTCEMLYQLATFLGVAMDKDMATQLYTGILTDTGSFRFSNTNQRVLDIAADLVAAGAEPALIAENVYDSARPQKLQLLARVLGTLRYHSDQRVASIRLTQAMLKETGATRADAEGFVNHLRSVKPVRIALMFREDTNGLIHVSLRSKGKVDVAGFAARFGGGGHRHAAAFRLPGRMVEVMDHIVSETVRYLDHEV